MDVTSILEALLVLGAIVMGTRYSGIAVGLWGASDVAGARIHASDESVGPEEIERMIVTHAPTAKPGDRPVTGEVRRVVGG